MKDEGICNLESNGLPTNKNSPISASHAFAIMAQDDRAKPAIKRLAKKALKR